MSKPLDEIAPPVLVFVKMPKGGAFPSDDAESELHQEWMLLEKWLARTPWLTNSPPMIFDNVWHFTEDKDTDVLRQFVSFLRSNHSTFRVCRIDGRLEIYY